MTRKKGGIKQEKLIRENDEFVIIGSFSDIHPQKMVESWLFGTMFYLFLEHLWCTHQFEDVCFSFFSSCGWMPERVCWWLLWWWSSHLLFFGGLSLWIFVHFSVTIRVPIQWRISAMMFTGGLIQQDESGDFPAKAFDVVLFFDTKKGDR